MTLQRLRILVLAVLLITLSTAVLAESIADYNRLLNSLSSQLDQARQLEQARPGSGVPVIKKLWNDCPATVCVPSGNAKSMNADLGWIRDELYNLQQGKDIDRAERISLLQERLGLLTSASDSRTGIGTASAQKAKSTLAGVLASNEYKPSLMERIMQKVNEAIASLFSHLNIPGSAVAAIGLVVIVVAVLVFIAVVVYLVLYFVRVYSGRPAGDRTPYKAQLKSNRRRTPESIIEAAERDAAAGQYRDAFRGIYLASILLLDRAKLLKYTEGVTNWEYLRTLKRAESPDPARIFSDMTLLFDEYIYGNRAVSSGDYNATLEHYRRLEGLF